MGLLRCVLLLAALAPALAAAASAQSPASGSVQHWVALEAGADLPADPAWQSEPAGFINRGLDRREYWYRVDVTIHSDSRGKWLFRAGLPQQFSEAWLLEARGRRVPLASVDQGATWQVELSDDSVAVLLRTEATGWHMQYLDFFRPDAYWQVQASRNVALAMYYGATLALMGLALALAVALRDTLYLYYALAQGAFAFFQLVAVDFWVASWVATPEWHSTIAYMAAVLVSLTFTRYTQSSLDSKHHALRLHRLLWALMAVYIAVLLIAPLVPVAVMLWLVAPLGLLTPVSLLAVGVWAVLKRIPSARFYLAGVLVYQSGMGVYTLGVSGVEVLSLSPVQQSLLLKVAVFGEALLLALGLAERYRHQQTELALRQRELVALKSQQAEELEALVALRTEELAESNRRLGIADATKARLFSIIGHDLRGGVGSLSLIFRNSRRDEVVLGAERLSQVRRVVAGLDGTLNDLLGWARSQQQSLEPRYQTVDAGVVVRNVADDLAGRFAERDVALSTQAIHPISLVTDADMLATMVRNLLSNALEHTDAGGHAELALVDEGDEALLSVSDTGSGMDDERLDQVRNVLGGATPQASGNRGLGLMLVGEFARLLGCSVAVSSTPAAGTRFELRLPLEAPAAAD